MNTSHMLWFLSLARDAGFSVDRYEDHAVGSMATNAQGRLWVETVTLTPKVVFGGNQPSHDAEDALHHAAHEACFIANSVRTTILVRTRVA